MEISNVTGEGHIVGDIFFVNDKPATLIGESVFGDLIFKYINSGEEICIKYRDILEARADGHKFVFRRPTEIEIARQILEKRIQCLTYVQSGV